MTRTGRREMLRGGLAAFCGLSGLAFAAPHLFAADGELAIPDRPMRLTRGIERDLAGEARLAVTRLWEVRFVRSGPGVAVTGRQLSARVDAPESLSAIAAIKEELSTAGIWPILLSEQGMSVTSGETFQQQDPAAATREAERLIAEKGLPVRDAARYRAFLAELQLADGALLDQLPGDLFFPRGEPVRRSERVELPGGVEGRFEVVYLAPRAPGCAWLGEAVREIVTRVGEDERRARESWRMVPA
ncbi:hypothetical protein EH32_10035 [Erythrobacter litoralis]|uniref:Uncharacterized protein n=1 Tax=Erythrobacter litoralis TaxID=39960 RepID=A0A074MXM6_9SPHN|nr:hypothetical protein [Erythrobacter litoralis]KEO96558.1 hypothetical protein EH32_10035 [Erythrobacter litoralis]